MEQRAIKFPKGGGTYMNQLPKWGGDLFKTPKQIAGYYVPPPYWVFDYRGLMMGGCQKFRKTIHDQTTGIHWPSLKRVVVLPLPQTLLLLLTLVPRPESINKGVTSTHNACVDFRRL